ncbi:zinc finger protein 737-like isoform X1 [Neodiprion fabricii]|uniref:zinc finger protein 737-like isoform X1 n=1 Tax=Neodiprion fabricii TaxID=2872261 RepID=UPI001ED939D4|nr:zinc finger protein 737-like isoform X1 [Neodiprion fabricii]
MSGADLCRLCAEAKDKLIGIYDAEGQKLGIELKILKCLQIQVVINDTLPLAVCLDCCVQLDQCSDFFEKTNQAQSSLRNLITETKPSVQMGRVDLNYVEKTMDFPKEEQSQEEGMLECQLSENYIDDSVMYFNDEQNNVTDNDDNGDSSNGHAKYNSEEMLESVKHQIGCGVESKKKSNKQTKKRTKRKAQMQKLEVLELGITSDLEEKCMDLNTKVKIKIPDNYMTGTESDVEMIEARAAEPSKPGRKRGEGLDRYPWLCTDCNDKLPSLEMLERHHEIVHNQQAKFMCVQCCNVYDKYYGFLTHVKRHKNKSKFSCEDCGKSFVHKKVLESHKAIHSEDRPHICQTCGKAFRQQSALYIHSRCHLPDTMKNRYQCDQCDKRFSTKPNLVTHKRIHSGVRNFTCDQCGKSFIQKGNLEAHFLTHSADKPYTCSQCPKAFKTPLQLKKHETVHTGAKPHQCAVCGRTFREKGTLREHHRIHTGAMPFTCEFCGKCFRFKGILTTHRRQHTGERPYSCLECQHHFTNWPNYNKHMKRRHGINTSHTKHLQQPQQQIQQQQHQNNSPEDAMTIGQHGTPTSMQVRQAVSCTSMAQPIILQTIPTTGIQNLQTQVPVTTQETVPRERSSSFYNAVPSALPNFLPPNLPYNFYNISNTSDSNLTQNR